MDNIIQNISLIAPELTIVGISIIVLLSGLFSRAQSPFPAYLCLALTVISTISYFIYCGELEGRLFSNHYAIGHTSYVMKSILLFLLSFYLLSYIGYLQSISTEYNYEYLFIILMSFLGGLIITSSINFIPLYLGIELTSLSSYVLAAFNKKDIKSSEAGLKYFILGAFASCLILFGLSFIYGMVGGLDFDLIRESLKENQNILPILGVVLVLCGLLFKLSVVPFHFWTPDVYCGSPIMSVSLFSSISKIPALFLSIILIQNIFHPVDNIYIGIFEILIIATLLVGSIGAVMQKSIKRLMAYSIILNIGFALIGVMLGKDGADKAIIYMVIYSINIIGFFTILYMLLGKDAEYSTIYHLKGIGTFKKFSAISISIILFSMIGIPPFSGFFAKYIILIEAFNKQYYSLFIFALLTSIISAYYYLKIIAMIYFSKPMMLYRTTSSNYSIFVAIVSLFFVLLFALLPLQDILHYKIFI